MGNDFIKVTIRMDPQIPQEPISQSLTENVQQYCDLICTCIYRHGYEISVLMLYMFLIIIESYYLYLLSEIHDSLHEKLSVPEI